MRGAVTTRSAKERQHGGIQAVRLGESAGRLRNVPHLPRVRDHHRQTGGGQGRHQGRFVAAGGLEDDQGRPDVHESRHGLGNAPAVVPIPTSAGEAEAHDEQATLRLVAPSARRTPSSFEQPRSAFTRVG